MTAVAATPTLPGVGAGPVVTLDGVGRSYGTGADAVTALEGVDLRVARGEFVCLLGASGCGKTTLLNLVAGLDRPTRGRVRVHAARPAVMFQEPALLPWLTALRNVELPLRLAGSDRAARRARARELLDLVRLADQENRRPHELSGGMRQRVALARALASTGGDDAGSRLLLMDEPFGALDAITRDVLQAELGRVWETTGTAVLFVSHDVREAVRLAQRVILLSSRPGTVVREWSVGDGAAPDELIAEITERLREVISSHAST